jgi:hypothetical protein
VGSSVITKIFLKVVNRIFQQWLIGRAVVNLIQNKETVFHSTATNSLNLLLR